MRFMIEAAGGRNQAMDKKTVVITGSGGLVGSYLKNILQDRYVTVGVDRQQKNGARACDLSDADAWRSVLQQVDPDIVVHCAALTWVDYCEEHHDETDRNNIAPVKTLAEWASNRKTQPHIVFISSDYVYDGIHPPFDESSPLLPLNYYARSKVEGEKIVSHLPNHTILRPGVIYGWHPGGTNFFMQTWNSLSENKPMKVVDDQINNPTYVETFVNAIAQCVDKKIFGTYVATGNETFSRFDFAVKIARAFGLDTALLARAKTSDFPVKAKRPMNCATSSAALQQKLGWPFPSIDATFAMLKKVKDKQV